MALVPAGRMTTVFAPAFGRRTPPRAPAEPREAPKPAAAPLPDPPLPVVPDTAITELRTACLARLDPNAVTAMPTDRLTADVERLVSEIATERRVQLNAREQRALAGELVHDILGLGPLEPLLEDETISDIMVNGPDRTFVERGGTVVLSGVRFRDTAHLSNICQRIAAAVGRRIDETSPMVDARL
jgi:pilus assembly protein CpaF